MTQVSNPKAGIPFTHCYYIHTVYIHAHASHIIGDGIYKYTARSLMCTAHHHPAHALPGDQPHSARYMREGCTVQVHTDAAVK